MTEKGQLICADADGRRCLTWSEALESEMLILPIEETKAGMKLVMTVSHPEQPDQELLKPGFILTDAVIGRLKSLGVPYVYVDYPDLADLDRHLMAHLSPARQVIYSHIKNTIMAVQRVARPTVTYPDYYAATRDMVITLLQQGEHPMYMDVLCARLGSDEVAHATTVAQLSVTIGIRLEQYLISQRSRLPPRHAREVINLGVAGMLHDIGKCKLPEHLRQHTGIHPPEKPEDRALWEAHPKISHDMICRGVEASAAAAVSQHHQHFDGSGYPRLSRPGGEPHTLKAQDIHVFGRILLVADQYDRFSIAEDGRRRSPIEVLHLMRTTGSQELDPHILDMLPTIIPPFPPGSRVTLSDGSLAVVTRVDMSDPYAPVIKRLGEDHWTLCGEPIALRNETSLTIRALEGLDVERMIPQAGGAEQAAKAAA